MTLAGPANEGSKQPTASNVGLDFFATSMAFIALYEMGPVNHYTLITNKSIR